MSVRNNKERIGAALDGNSPIIPQNMQDPLNFVVPTMHVDLPSKGQYYEEGHPLHNQESVEIRYMTAKDEDILTSPSLIRKKIVLDRLVQSLFVDKRIKADSLLLGDKNAILIQARISGFGQWYEVSVTCPSCEHQQEHEYDLEECSMFRESEKELDEVELLENGNFTVTLPKTNAKCEIKLLRGPEGKSLIESFEQSTKRKNERYATDFLRLMIKSVNEFTEKKVIDHFIDHMPIPDSRFIRYAYSKINPTVDLIAKFECEECGHQEDMEVPLTSEFFWPKQ